MEDSAQKVIFVDEANDEATDKLHQKTGEHLNKAGFSENPQSLDPHHKSIIEKIKILGQEARHDASRLTEQTVEELTSGSHYISDIKSSEPLAIKAELGEKKQEEREEVLKKAA